MSTKFAGLPVRLYRFNGKYWEPTGKKAWLRRIGYVDTVWFERFYVETTP